MMVFERQRKKTGKQLKMEKVSISLGFGKTVQSNFKRVQETIGHRTDRTS